MKKRTVPVRPVAIGIVNSLAPQTASRSESRSPPRYWRGCWSRSYTQPSGARRAGRQANASSRVMNTRRDICPAM